MLKPFRVLQPASVGEASRELNRYGDAAKVYAGGSELLILLRQGLIECDYLVNIKGILGLGGLDWDGKRLHVGANVTHRQLERSPIVRGAMPVLCETESLVANVRVRNVGTLGGNLCFSDPHSDPGTLLLVYDAEVLLSDGQTSRRMPLQEFFVDSYETALEPAELLTGVDMPALPDGVRAGYQRIERYERPSLGVAAAAALRDGRLADVRLAVGCIGPKPVRLRDLEAKLEGLSPAEAQSVIQGEQPALRDVLEPVDDIHGSADYKIHVASVLLARTLGDLTPSA